jgi:hypothetical protein
MYFLLESSQLLDIFLFLILSLDLILFSSPKKLLFCMTCSFLFLFVGWSISMPVYDFLLFPMYISCLMDAYVQNDKMKNILLVTNELYKNII